MEFKKPEQKVNKGVSVKAALLLSAFAALFPTKKAFGQVESVNSGEDRVEFSEQTDSKIQEARQWIIDYISSPKYREILREELLASGVKGERLEEELDKQIKARIQLVEDASLHIEEGVIVAPDTMRALIESSILYGRIVPRSVFRQFKEYGIKGREVIDIYADLVRLKKLLSERGYFDPKTEEINLDVLKKALEEDRELMNHPLVKKLLEKLENLENLKEMMNTVADRESDGDSTYYV